MRRSLVRIFAIAALLFASVPGFAASHGGTLTIVSTAIGATSLGYGAMGRNVQSQFYERPVSETLLRWDSAGLPSPWLATGWEIADDLSSITFTISSHHLLKGDPRWLAYPHILPKSGIWMHSTNYNSHPDDRTHDA